MLYAVVGGAAIVGMLYAAYRSLVDEQDARDAEELEDGETEEVCAPSVQVRDE